MTYSRRVKRLRAGWDGTCQIEGEAGEWPCRVVDISVLGLGVTLKHASPSQLAGRRISVDVPAVARLEGEITNAVPILGGAVRVGIMFDKPPTSTPDIAPVESVVGDSGNT